MDLRPFPMELLTTHLPGDPRGQLLVYGFEMNDLIREWAIPPTIGLPIEPMKHTLNRKEKR